MSIGAGKTIMLTGGSGFIGSHTALVLSNLGYKVVIVDNFENSLCVALRTCTHKPAAHAPRALAFAHSHTAPCATQSGVD
jgi:UDP-glucose 4-epimerase